MLIGEVSRRSGVSVRMLRHYESIGLVVPSDRTAGGYRRYSEQDIRRIFEVESLRSLGLSLREAGRALSDPDFSPAALVDDLIGRTRARLAREEDLLSRLQRIKHTGPEEWDEVLRIVALLRALGSKQPDRRQRAALQIAPEAPAAELLIEALLDEDDPNVAGALRWALARSGPGTGEALDRVVAALRSPDPQTRRRAVHVADAAGDRVTAPLRELLGDPDDVVRTRAALTLARRGDRAVVPVLIEMILAGLSDVEAAEALVDLAGNEDGGAQIVAVLGARIAGAPSGARRRVAQALADLPYESARTVLDVLARDPDPAVSLTARAVTATAEARRDPGTA